jgi:hypothetical protein
VPVYEPAPFSISSHLDLVSLQDEVNKPITAQGIEKLCQISSLSLRENRFARCVTLNYYKIPGFA